MLTIVTSNEKKFLEMKAVLGDVERIDLELEEIQGSAEDIIKHKAKEAFSKVGKPCIVEDVSFGFEAWNWFPGPYIKHFVKLVGVQKLPSLLKDNKRARAVCTIGYAKSEEDIEVVQGIVYGNIVEARQDNGFAFDLIFVPDGFDKTYSQMSLEEKNKISHRRKALEKLKEIIGR